MVKKFRHRILLSLLLGFIIYILLPLPQPLLDNHYSLVIEDEHGKTLRIFLNQNEQWCLPPEDSLEVPEKLVKSVLFFEDRYFFLHPGINPVSVFRAAWQNISRHRIVSGASTITMQVARLHYQGERTLMNKIREMFLALKIEFHNPKNDILKLYLNHAPYGSNIIGYRAASERYFRKTPNELSWGEAALLAVLPNAPSMVSPMVNKDNLRNKRNHLLELLLKNHVIDEETYHLAMIEPIPEKEYPFEMTAPHLTRKIFAEHMGENNPIKTTLDYRIQKHLENLLQQYSRYLQYQGIRNGAALVVETQTGKVKAYVGSQNFMDMKNQGQVDGILAKRSSGSILKPFLYAASMDDGLIVPQTLMMDVPSYFDAFSPSNADEKFNGVVPAGEALIRSLNIPAVRLLNMYGVSRFYTLLVNAGVSTLFRQPGDYGLPLIIGGAEVTLWDMATLFRGLGNMGTFGPSYYLEKEPATIKNHARQLISEGACMLTLNILRELKRPGAEYYWEQYQNQQPIAWKTGTSYGNKDAWAIGVSPQWTIAVWTGNFDSETNPNIAGAATAGPLLFEIFNSLPHDPSLKWFEGADMDFRKITLCSETGFLAGPACPHPVETNGPAFMLPLRICPYHHTIYVDKNEQHTVCSYCWKPGYHEKKVLEYPAEVNFYLKKRGQLVTEIPPHNPQCQKLTGEAPFQIIYPVDSAHIWIPREYGGKYEKLIARVAHNNPSKKIFWYLDDRYLGITVQKHTMALEMIAGWHNLLITDQYGYQRKVRFYINRAKK